MNQPINLGAKRAFKSNDNTDWTPLDMMKKMVTDIESGEAKPEQMLLLYWETSADGEGFFPVSLACQVSRQEELAMLEISKRGLMRHWLKDEELP